ncbi:MAG: cell division protein SepF [Clostridia bacterium]
MFFDSNNDKTRKLIKEFAPKKFEDIQRLLTKVQRKESVMVDINELPADFAQRMLDFLCGGIYALGGTVRLINTGEYILIPKGVKVSTTRKE